jgi:glycosyltransferase involved in cell wall biosynthesis
MHVTFVVKVFGPRGGTEEYVRAVGEALAEQGHQLSFLYEEPSMTNGGGWPKLRERFAVTQLSGDGAARARTLRGHLSANRPDVLFVHSASFTAEMYDVTAGTVPLVRFVHDFRPVCMRISKVFPVSRLNCTRTLGYSCLLHGCSIGPARGGLLPFSYNQLRAKLSEREIARRFDCILVASRFMRNLLVQNGFAPERVRINPLFSPSGVPSSPSALPAGSRLLYIGQLERFKGLAVLLEAMRRLPGTTSLDVAGDGPWRKRLESMTSKWNLEGRVRFHGWVERESLGSLISAATIVVVPSTWNEPFGLVGLQAMAYARPVVAFDVGGITDWLEDGVTGVIVPEPSGDCLASAIAELSEDRGRAARLGAAGYRQLQERFTLERHVEQLVSCLGVSAGIPQMSM